MYERSLRSRKKLGDKLPANIVADAGYGSEENYEYLEKESLGNYVKYNAFHKEATPKWKSDVTRVQNWQYNKGVDEYICGNGQTLRFKYEKTQKSKNGFSSLIRVYESDDCKECPYRERCIKKTDKPDFNKRIYINRRG